MRTISLDEFRNELKEQGIRSHEHSAFRCVMCGTIQSGKDLMEAGAGKNFDEVERFVGFSCVGRWTNAGPHPKGGPPGYGCDWTLGGFFTLHELEVVTPDGKKHPRFAIATPQEAQALQAKHDAARRAEHEIPAPQHSAPEPCSAAGGLEMVQRWHRQLIQAQTSITQLQVEIDQGIYGNGKTDTFNLEDAANRIEVVLDHMGCACIQVDRALAALRKEMHRIEDGEL